MGGAVDGGVGNCIKTSPPRSAIEKAQAELRQEYNVREERRRELEFLDKGGNPLDFKFRNVVSLSLQSTSLADHHPEWLNSSEAKGSFSLAASPQGDSVESSGRPGPPSVSGQKSTDSPALLDGENEMLQGEKNLIHLDRKNNITSSEQSSQMDGNRNAKESEDSAIFRPYARRNRTRTNHDGAQFGSAEGIHYRSGQGPSLVSRASIREAKVSSTETKGQKETPKLLGMNGDIVSRTATPESCLNGQIDGEQALLSTTSLKQVSLPGDKLDITEKGSKDNNWHKQPYGNCVTPDLACSDLGHVFSREGTVSAGTDDLSSLNKEREIDCSGKLNGSCDFKGESKTICNEVQSSCEAFDRKGSDSSIHPSAGMDVRKDNVCNDAVKTSSNGHAVVQPSESKKNQKLAGGEMLEQEDTDRIIDCTITASNENHDFKQNQAGNVALSKGVEETNSRSDGLKKESDTSGAVEDEHGGQVRTQNEREEIKNDHNCKLNRDTFCNNISSCEAPDTSLSEMELAAPDCQTSGNNLSMTDKGYEDSVLEEARIIQAKHKRIAELSGHTSPLENRHRCHWNFVLEEMAWLSNDFAQERLWKTTAAAQLCHHIASLSRYRCEEQSQRVKLKLIARNMAKAVVQFWHTAEVLLNGNNPNLGLEATRTESETEDPNMESLFYTIPFGAMETYRKSIEAYVTECERTGSNVQEDAGTSIFNIVEGYQENAYDEDEAETSTYYLPGTLEGSKSSKFTQKKRKNQGFYEQGADLHCGHYTTVTQPSTLVEKKPGNLAIGPIPAKRMRTANASRQRVPSPFGPGAHGIIQAQAKNEVSSGDMNSSYDDQNSLLGGSRIQKGFEVESTVDFEKHISYDYAETLTKLKKKKKARHLDPTFEPGWQMGSAALSEQREQSKKRLENFESNRTSGLYAQQNAKKPKTIKHSLDNMYDNIMSTTGSIPCPMTSQMSNMPNQKLMRYIGGRDRSRKAKALKASSLHSGPGSPWALFEDQALVVLVHDMGPNWELVSDTINSTLQFKCIFRNAKDCKERHKFLMDKNSVDGADSAEDSGSSQPYPSTLPGIPKGSARQLFQRLQGPVEEDTLKEHFDKIIHIAQRQHHRRIQLKNESQDLKQIPVHNSHFVALSKVIPNNLNGDFLTPLHLIEPTASSPDVLQLGYQGSHASNLAMQNQGGSISTGDAASGVNSPIPGSSGFVLGNNMPPASPLNAPMRDGRYNVPKTLPSPGDEQHRIQPYNQMLSNRTTSQSNLSIPGAVPGSDRGVRVLPGGNGLGMNRNTMPMARPGLPGMASSPVLNSSSLVPSPTAGAQSPVNIRTGSVATQGRPRESMQMAGGGHNTEQQRQMTAKEFRVHVTQGSAQGVPPFNGIGPSFSSQTTSTVQSYPGNPGHSLQQQSHAPNNPQHHPQLEGANHGTSQQHQIYLGIAKERHLQQQYLQQQFTASNNLIPNVQSPPQITMSSPLQNSSQIQSQSPSQSTSLPPLTPSSAMTPMASQQHQQKNQLPPHSHGLPRNLQATVGSLTNQVGPKQRQRQVQQQQLQPSGRAHPQQRPQQQPHQQQAKVLMGMGRGNLLAHQKLPMDHSHLNGLSTAPGSMEAEKEMMQQGQGLYSGTGINQVQPSKAPITQAPHHSQMPSTVAVPHSTKQHPQQQVPSHSENTVQGQFSDIPPGHNTSSAQHQAVPSTLMNPHILQPQPQHNQISQTQTVAHRMHPQNRQHMNYEQMLMKSQPSKAHAAERKLVNTVSPQAGTGSAATPASAIKAVVAASPPVPLQCKVSEAGVTSTSAQVGAIGSPTLPSSIRSEQLPPVGQGGLGQRHLVENLPQHSHGGSGAHGALKKQLSGPMTSSSQQHCLPPSQEQREAAAPKQHLLQPQPQPPQTQHLQAAQGSLYIGQTNS